MSENIVDISDISGILFDLSDNFYDLSGKYYTLSGELDDFMKNVKTTDASIDVIMANTAPNVTFNSDVSFNYSIDVSDTVTTKAIVGDTTYTNPLHETFDVKINSSVLELNSVLKPTLTLYKNSTYHFDLTDSTNNVNELLFSAFPDGHFGPGDMKMHYLFHGQQHNSIGSSYKDYSINLTDYETSLIGCQVYIYFRYDTSNNTELGDLQIKHLTVNGSNITSSSTWETTVNTTNSEYEHNNNTWTTVTEGSSSGRWNIQAAGDSSTATGNTGLQNSVGAIYYEDTGDVNDAYVYLRSPAITLTSNNITLNYGAYGSGIGSLYYGIYAVTSLEKPYTNGITETGSLAGNDLSYTWVIPNDAPDTLYYAGDVSRNIGGTINIEDEYTERNW